MALVTEAGATDAVADAAPSGMAWSRAADARRLVRAALPASLNLEPASSIVASRRPRRECPPALPVLTDARDDDTVWAASSARSEPRAER
jgi:hypothetical protein